MIKSNIKFKDKFIILILLIINNNYKVRFLPPIINVIINITIIYIVFFNPCIYYNSMKIIFMIIFTNISYII